MFCRSCGREIANDAVVCIGCGRATGLAIPSQVPVMAPAAAPAASAEADSTGLTIAAFLTAAIIPMVGLILAIILIAKGRSIGWGALVVSLISWALWCGAAMGG